MGGQLAAAGRSLGYNVKVIKGRPPTHEQKMEAAKKRKKRMKILRKRKKDLEKSGRKDRQMVHYEFHKNGKIVCQGLHRLSNTLDDLINTVEDVIGEYRAIGIPGELYYKGASEPRTLQELYNFRPDLSEHTLIFTVETGAFL